MRATLLTSMAVAGLVMSAPAGADSDAEKREICAEAWKRYQTLEDAPKPTGPNAATVLMYKYTFCPFELTVKAGTTVHFINVDKRTSHSVWFKEAGQDESERLFPEEGWSLPLLDPGRYPYLCGPHWEQEGMVGAVTVTPE